MREAARPLRGQSRLYICGTFVADATTTQDIAFTGSNGGLLHGFQLRQTARPAAPEPGTAPAGPRCRGGSVRAADVPPPSPAGGGGAEADARASSAPPLPTDA